MLNSRLIKYILFTGILIIFLLMVISVLRAQICSGKMFPFARQYVEMFFPPADLYCPVLDEKINIAAIGQHYTFKFKLKYIGHYVVYISPYRPDEELYGKYDSKLRLTVNFYKDNILLFSVPQTDNHEIWIGARGNELIECQFISQEIFP